MIARAILGFLAARRITLFLEKGELRYRAPISAYTPDLRALVAEYRDKVVQGLQAAEVRAEDNPKSYAADGSHLQLVAPRKPCPQCGTLELWETVTGRWRCMRCDPPIISRRILALAQKIRREVASPRAGASD